ncbi:helix-turn-helix domain-containing protein [Brevibacillus ginsengisoli]|uniref:helix-turn-helix domain-containing protein n=1 Tax=Brevibacillus ginsengisoli TaxID=363854 RepID=UPI003CF4E17D
MGFTYKPLWHLLIERGMKRTDLKEVIGISPSTLAKLGKDEIVSLDVIDKICSYFECRIDDVIEHQKDKDRQL